MKCRTTPLVYLPALSLLSISLALAVGTTVEAQELASKPVSSLAVTAKKPISHDVYANWRSIQGTQLSQDGVWLAYALQAQEGDGEIIVKNLKDGRQWRSPRGMTPQFSADGRYLAFAIRPTQAELEKAKKDKKKAEDAPKPGLGLMDLASGKVSSFERVKRFAFAEQAGNHLAVLFEMPQEKKEQKKSETNKADQDAGSRDQQAPANAADRRKTNGSEFFLINPANLQTQVFAAVSDFQWNKPGTQLALVVNNKEPLKDATTKAANKAATPAEPVPEKPAAQANNKAQQLADGVWLLEGQFEQAKAVLTGKGSYKHLSFDEAGTQLAFVSNRDDVAAKKNVTKTESQPDEKKDEKAEPGIFKLYYLNLAQQQALAAIVDTKNPALAKNWSVSEHASLSFSKDGQRLYFGTAEIPPAEAKDAAEPVKLDLWHWRDPELQSMQKVRAEREKQRSYKAVYHLATQTMVQLASKAIPEVLVNENSKVALGIDTAPYKQLQSWDGLYRDIYAIDLTSGKARQLAQKMRFNPSLSPMGNYVLVFDHKTSQWLAYPTAEAANAKAINLTAHIKQRFDDVQQDTPQPRSAYGYAGWTENDESVVLYDQFDLWEVAPATLQSKNLTAGYGRKKQLELRYLNIDDDKKNPMQEEPGAIADAKALPKERLILAATHEINRGTGFYQVARAGGEPQRLLHDDKLFGNLQKAKHAEQYVFTRQSFNEFPDLWQAPADFSQAQKVSQANPQQENYLWGKQEMISFTSADGKKLRALLAKPENFDPAKKYPLMVYIYENMTDNMHKYVAPAPGQNINVTRYLSNGYIVLRPDIVYTTGQPGKSAYNAVMPAINSVVKQGYIDPKRIGIQGHSWGAYQINYLLTRTNIFRAAEAGASMANMSSGYGGIRWGTGMSRAFQYQTGQSRMGGAPWDKTAAYIENSPLFHIDKITTPYLTVHNDDDDAVPFYQAIEMFSALRQLGKEAYWFNYNGEKHGLKERDNVKHFSLHMAEFFDHYLLGSPRPAWMETPTPYLERGKRDVSSYYKPQASSESKQATK